MKHEVAAGDGFGPAGVGGEIGCKKRQRASRRGVACLEHRAQIELTRQRTHRRALSVAGVQQLQDAMRTDKSGLARQSTCSPLMLFSWSR